MNNRTVYSAYTETRASRVRENREFYLRRMRDRLAAKTDEEYSRRVRDHFDALRPTLFEDGVPAEFGEVVLERVQPRDAWHRIEEKRCVLCGRHLTSEQALRYSVGPECFERVFHGLSEVRS